MLHILSYNILFGHRTEDVLLWLSQKEIDIVCLQEFPEAKLPLLEKLFPLYTYEFVTSFRWDKTYGQVTLYKKEKLTMVSAKKFHVSHSRIKKALLGFGENRQALITRFRYGKKMFSLINTHLTPIAFNKRRIIELKKILEEITSEPTVILGDFNYSSLLPRKKFFTFMQAHKFIHATEGIVTHKFAGLPHQMDYIFSRDMTVKNVMVIKKKFSDHQPIFAEIELN